MAVVATVNGTIGAGWGWLAARLVRVSRSAVIMGSPCPIALSAQRLFAAVGRALRSQP